VLSRLAARGAQRVEQPGLAGDAINRPEGRRVRRDPPEQRRRLAHRAEVAQRLAAVGEHHRQVTHDPARVVAPGALAHPPKARARAPR